MSICLLFYQLEFSVILELMFETRIIFQHKSAFHVRQEIFMQKKLKCFSLIVIAVLVCCTTAVIAQTTEFTYQGKLTDTGTAANGQYDFTFRLFDSASGGAQISTDIFIDNVSVSSGIFTVNLDFGTTAFSNGAARFLEISVRTGASTGAFTLLTPRQQIKSAPFAIKSLDSVTATNVSGIVQIENGGTGSATKNFIDLTTNQTAIGGDKTFTGILAGNGSGLTNLNGFNIATGTVNTDQLTNLSVTEAKLNSNVSNRLLAMPGTANVFAGSGAGSSNTGGSFNSFFGTFAGRQNLNGSGNVFFGRHAGDGNDSGSENVFLGHLAGSINSTGSNNTIVGSNANVAAGNFTFATAIGAGSVVSSSNTITMGRNNGADTVFIPGALNVTGNITGTVSNATEAANAAKLGGVNASQYVQTNDSRLSDNRNPTAGSTNYIQNLSTALIQPNSGFSISDTGKANLFDATQYNLLGFPFLSVRGTISTSVGVNAGLNNTGSFNLFLGSSTGFSNTSGAGNTFAGATAGNANVGGGGNSFFGAETGRSNVGGNSNSFYGYNSGVTNVSGSENTLMGWRTDTTANNLFNAAAIGSRATVSQNNSIVLGSIQNVNGCNLIINCDTVKVGIGTTAPQDRLDVNGIIRVSTLGVGGPTQLCLNASNQISNCSSSLRYKNNIDPYSAGLNLVTRLSPITFNWKQSGLKDLGLGAEDVEKIEPLLVTYNAKGEVEGVKYDRVAVVLVNAVQEQQTQIEQQKKLIETQQLQIDALKKLVCDMKPNAEICKEKE